MLTHCKRFFRLLPDLTNIIQAEPFCTASEIFLAQVEYSDLRELRWRFKCYSLIARRFAANFPVPEYSGLPMKDFSRRRNYKKNSKNLQRTFKEP